MLVRRDGTILHQEDCRLERKAGAAWYWHGLLYADGAELTWDGLYGAFTCFCVTEDRVLAFTDNSKQHALYTDGTRVSNSFLELLEDKRLLGETILYDPLGVMEILTFGMTYFGKTCVEGVSLVRHDEFVEISRGEIRVLDKEIGALDRPSRFRSMDEGFDHVARLLKPQKVSAALTAGYDSRLVFSALNNRIELTPFISGDPAFHKEIPLAEKVAEAGGHHLEVLTVPRPELDDQLVLELFRMADGMMPFACSDQYRIFSFLRNREEQGFRILLTGDGGGLHKDWEWMQDMPFYSRRRTNYLGFYRHRVAFLPRTGYLSAGLRNLYDGYEAYFLEQAKRHGKALNTQTYDQLFFEINGLHSAAYNVRLDTLTLYAPLNELEIARYSYALPRRARAFNWNMKRQTTLENRAIAALPTNYRTTASVEPRYVVRDVLLQGVEFGRKALRLTARKLLKRNLFNGRSQNWHFYEDEAGQALARRHLRTCQEQGWVAADIEVEGLDEKQLSRIVYLSSLVGCNE